MQSISMPHETTNPVHFLDFYFRDEDEDEEATDFVEHEHSFVFDDTTMSSCGTDPSPSSSSATTTTTSTTTNTSRSFSNVKQSSLNNNQQVITTRGGLTNVHLDPIASRNWKTVLGWIAFHPDQVATLVDREGQTCLHHACLFRAPLNVIESMLFAAPNLASIANDEGELALHWAVRLALPVQVLASILEANPQSGFQRDNENRTPLCLLWDRHHHTLYDVYRIAGTEEALRFLSWKRLMMLVNASYRHLCATTSCQPASATTSSSVSSSTGTIGNQEHAYSLHSIVSCDCPTSFVKFAIHLYRSDLTRRDHDGNLPLHLACMFARKKEILQLLIGEYEEATRQPNSKGKLPFHLLIESGGTWEDGVDIFLKMEPNLLYQRDAESQLYPCMLAASSQQPCTSTIYQLLRADPSHTKR